jgi:hypothetical protein
MTTASLRLIALSSQYNTLALTDAERAVATLAARAARGAERTDALLARHSLDLNRGAISDALTATEMLAEDRSNAALAARLRVTDYLYGNGDSTAAAQAAEWLRRHVASYAPAGPTSAWPSDAANNACVVSREVMPRDSSANDLCWALTDAIGAASARSGDAWQRAALADSLFLARPPDDALRDYAGLAMARVWSALGEHRRALDAARRRPHMRRWPHYLAAHLEAEGRIADALGDSVGAVAAYSRYLNLRTSPERHVRAEVAAVRATLDRLSGLGR